MKRTRGVSRFVGFDDGEVVIDFVGNKLLFNIRRWEEDLSPKVSMIQYHTDVR